MEINRRMWSGLALLAAVIAATVFWCRHDGTGKTAEVAGEVQKSGSRLKTGKGMRSRAEARAEVQRKARAMVRKGRKNGILKPRLTPEERKELERRQLLLKLFAENARESDLSVGDKEFLEVLAAAEQEEDIDLVADAAQAALKSESVEVRRAVVEALAAFGEAGIPELADYLKDPDPDIAALAVDRYELALQEVERDEEIAVLAKLATMSLADEDQLGLMMSQIEMVDDELLAVQTMVDIIDEGGEEAVEAAKESYERYTGEEWSGIEAAEKWLQENYEPTPPDDDDGTPAGGATMEDD